MQLAFFLYAHLAIIALGAGSFSIALYLLWKRDETFVAFSLYSLGIAAFLGVGVLIQSGKITSDWPIWLYIFLSGVVMVAFYEANRVTLGGHRAKIDYVAVIVMILLFLIGVTVRLVAPERIEHVYFPDRLGQVIIVPRIRGFYSQELPNLGPAIVTVTAWLIWTVRHIQFLWAARHRLEFKLGLPVVLFSILAPIHDFGLIMGWWGGIFLSFFSFGVMAFSSALWLLYQLYEHSRMLEDLTRNLENKVEERTLQLKAANLHLEEVNALKNDFLAICSHDLKNMLVSVQGYSELLEMGLSEGMAPEKLKEYSGEVRIAALRMLDLIKDLLDSARLESGRAVLEKQPSWVGEVVGNAFAQYRREAEHKGVRYNLDLSEDLPELPLDRSKFQQAVANLLHNALKFTPEGGEVFCRVSRVGEGCSVVVADTGPGIAEADQGIVFDKFAIARKRRQDRSTKLGTGLGLSITKTFVELHGGRIDLFSKPGEGTRFEIYLPGAEGYAPGDPS